MFPLFLFLLFISLSSPQSLDLISCNEPTQLLPHSPHQLHLSIGPEEHSMVAMWTTQWTTPTSSIKYFTGPCAFDGSWKLAMGSSFSYDGFNGVIHKVLIKNLIPGLRYCYSVGDPCSGWSQPHEFRVPPKNRVMFLAIADSGTWGNVSRVMRSIEEEEEGSMLIHAGDLGYAQNEEVWDTWGGLMEQVASSRPYMIIPGNWDVKPFAVKAFLSRFKMPLVVPSTETQLNYYYSFNYSLLHVVMMSSYDNYSVSSAQYAWLETDLQAAQQDRKNRPWIIVCFHSPMYSSSVGHGGGDEAFKSVIEPLLRKYQVDLALTGHDHGYERTFPVYNNVPVTESKMHYVDPTSTVHILVGTGGASLDTWMSPKPHWSAHRESSHGYTKFHVTSTTLHIIYRRMDGTLGDEFWISKGAISTPRYIVVIIAVLLFLIFPLCAFHGLHTRFLEVIISGSDNVYKHV